MKYRYEIALQRQPGSYSAAELSDLLQSGKVEPTTLVWEDTDGEPVYLFLCDLLGKLREKEGVREPMPFVPYVESPHTLHYGSKPNEFFQQMTRAERIEAIQRFMAEKSKTRK